MVSGFLQAEPRFDDLKALLQLSSYTNIVNADTVFSDELVSINLYHSEFDRLVPVNNTQDFFDTLQGNVQVTLHQDMCNSTGFRLLFGRCPVSAPRPAHPPLVDEGSHVVMGEAGADFESHSTASRLSSAVEETSTAPRWPASIR